MTINDFYIIVQQQFTYHRLQLIPDQPATRTGNETGTKVEVALVYGGILVSLALTGCWRIS